jgi:hypothetical protein
MSRYSRIVKGKEYAWGFDPISPEYFFQRYDEHDEIVFSVGSYFTENPHPMYPNRGRYSNSQLLELIEHEEKMIGRPIVDKEHKDAIALDLVF